MAQRKRARRLDSARSAPDKKAVSDTTTQDPHSFPKLVEPGKAPMPGSERPPELYERPTMAGLAEQLSAEHTGDDPKVVNLAYYRIKRSLKEEGFDLIADDQGKLKLVLRVGR